MASDTERLARYRDEGWCVAIHNDYMWLGERFTFWLLTRQDLTPQSRLEHWRAGRYVKGEGRTDAEAFDAIDAAMRAAREQEEPSE